MGKHKRQRRVKKSSDPLQKSDKRYDKVREERILPLVAGLKSAKPIERALSLSAASSMSDEKPMRELLLREGLLNVILTHTLSDSSNELVSEAFGLLRNVVLDEGRDVATFLMDHNIAVFMNSAGNLLLSSNLDSKVLYELVENICGLLTALIIHADRFDENQHMLRVVEVAAAIIKQSDIPPSLHNAAFELLFYATSEEWAIKTPPNLQNLAKTTTSRVYEAGIDYYVSENISAVAANLEKLVGELNLSHLGREDETNDKANVSEAEKNNERVGLNEAQVFFEVAACVAEIYPLACLPKALDALRIDELVPAALSYINNQGWTLSASGQRWAPEEADAIWQSILPLLLSHAALGLRPLVCIALQYGRSLDDLPLEKIMDRAEELRQLQNKYDWTELMAALVVALPLAPNMAYRSAELLFQILENSTELPPSLIVDSLDALFDLFGDNDADYDKRIYQNGAYNQRLISARQDIRNRIQSAAEDDQFHERALEGLENLDSFIEYKNVN